MVKKTKFLEEPTPGFYSELITETPDEVRLVKVVGRREAYTYIVRNPGISLEDLLVKLAPLKVGGKDLPGILNPMGEGDGYIKIRREGKAFRVYPKDPKEPRMPGDIFLRYLG